MSNMINLDFICMLRRTDNFLLFAFKDLCIENSQKYFDYLQVISQFRLNFNRDSSRFPDATTIAEIEDEQQKAYLLDIIQSNSTTSKHIEKEFSFFEDMENLLCGIPQTIKYTLKTISHYYYFVLGTQSVLMCVSDEFDPTLREDLIQLSRRFETIFSDEIIENTNEILFSNEILYTFTDILSQKLINRYYIPHFSHNGALTSLASHFTCGSNKEEMHSILEEINPLIEYIRKSNKRVNNTPYDQLLTEIDGISDIDSIAEHMGLENSELTKILLYLWLKNQIIFRIPVYNWDIFERTHKSNEYLLDGSESQKELLELYGGGKIISLLSRFDGRSTIAEIHKKMNINDLRFMRYVYDLFDMGLIQKSEKFPVLKHIGQEIVPLLVIQGLQQKDLKIIEELESQFDGSRSITSVALKMDESPEKIKQILDKIPEFVQYNSI